MTQPGATSAPGRIIAPAPTHVPRPMLNGTVLSAILQRWRGEPMSWLAVMNLACGPTRTFAPIVAGASTMHRRTFTAFNVVGGSAWVALMLGLGFGLGSRFPSIGDYLDVAVLAIVVLSLVPIGIEYLRQRRAQVQAGRAAQEEAGS